MIRLLFAALLALSLPARAAVTVDAIGTQLPGTGAFFNYTGITVGTGNNRVLLCAIGANGTFTNPSFTWDSAGAAQAMTQIKTIQNTIQGELWGLVNPVSGNKNLAASWTTSRDAIINCISFNGGSQVGGTTTFYNSNSASGNSTTLAVTCNTIATGDIAVDTGSSDSIISAPTQTLIAGGSGGTTVNMAMSRANGAGANISFGWTASSGVWVDLCTGVAAAPGGQHLLPIMKVGQ